MTILKYKKVYREAIRREKAKSHMRANRSMKDIMEKQLWLHKKTAGNNKVRNENYRAHISKIKSKTRKEKRRHEKKNVT